MEEPRILLDTEPITKKQVHSLINALGFSAIAINWNVDYTCGRGIITTNKTEQKHCLWCEDGRRIDINISIYGQIVSQTKDPDPDYLSYKGKYT